MNVRVDQLEDILSRQLYPVYLIGGDEPLQLMEAADQVRAACRQQGYVDREVFNVDAGFDWLTFINSADSLSLFSSQRLLDLRIPTAKPGKQGSQVIQTYLENPAPDTILLITTGKFDKSTKASAWYKAIDKQGLVIQCWPVTQDQLPSWVRQRFQRFGLIPDREVVDYVCSNVEGNLLAAAQEIDKLRLLLGQGAVTFDQVREVVTDNSRYNIFELADMALQGNQSKVLKIADSLKLEGIEPILVIWSLAKEIRLMRTAMADPASAEYMLTRSGVWKSRLPLFRRCMARHSEKSFEQLLQRCAVADGVSKGFEPGNIWDELRMLCFRLAGSSRLATAK